METVVARLENAVEQPVGCADDDWLCGGRRLVRLLYMEIIGHSFVYFLCLIMIHINSLFNIAVDISIVKMIKKYV